MKKLEIIGIDNYQYTFKDSDNKIYSSIMNFYDIEEKPQIGDFLYLNEELLKNSNKNYSDYYCFGSLDDPTGREITDENSPDLVVVQSKEKSLKLKRLYG